MNDDDILQLRLAEIRKLPPDQQDAALEQLSRDYPGIQQQLRGDQQFAEEMAMTPMPEGRQAGNNQFSVYVAANPLEHLAAGANRFMGHRDRRRAGDEMKQNQADAQSQTQALMAARLRDPMAMLNQWEEDEKIGYRGMPGRRY